MHGVGKEIKIVLSKVEYLHGDLGHAKAVTSDLNIFLQSTSLYE
jgi:hypothetical protein